MTSKQLGRARTAVAAVAGALLPREWRRRLAMRVPRLPLTTEDQHAAGASKDVAYWERWFARAPADPWRYDTNERELAKYRRTLEVCEPLDGAHALELGCATGVFTTLLATHVASLVAMDISEVALRRARSRAAALRNVRFERRTVPDELPDGSFDLIVCSDLLYYLTEEDVRATARGLAARTARHARIVVVNHERTITTPTDRVFAIVGEELRVAGFCSTHDEWLEVHRIARFDR